VAGSVTTAWNTPGLRRTNTSDDGSTNEEELLTVEPPNSFSYRIDTFTSPRLREVIDSIEGSWYLSDQEDGTTSIEWTYALNPVDEPARRAIKEDLLPLYTERLKTAMTILKNDLEC
jgi:hypothetical protein